MYLNDEAYADEYPKYYPPIGSCDYDERQNDMYYIGDSEGESS